MKYEFLTEDSVTQAQSDETMHLTNTEVAFSNINEMSHVMNKKNRSSDKKTGKSQPPSQNPTKPQKYKTSLFIVGDSMIQKIDGYLLTRFLKHQYLVKARPFLTAKTTNMYDYIKPTQRDFKPEIFVLHIGINDLPLKIH